MTDEFAEFSLVEGSKDEFAEFNLAPTSPPEGGITRQDYFKGLQDGDVLPGQRLQIIPVNPVEAGIRADEEFKLHTETGIELPEAQKEVAIEKNIEGAKSIFADMQNPVEVAFGKQKVPEFNFAYTKGQKLLDDAKADRMFNVYGVDPNRTTEHYRNMREIARLNSFLLDKDIEAIEKDVKNGVLFIDSVAKSDMPFDVVSSVYQRDESIKSYEDYLEYFNTFPHDQKTRELGKKLISVPVIGDILVAGASTGGPIAALGFKVAGKKLKKTIGYNFGFEEFSRNLLRDSRSIKRGATEETGKIRQSLGNFLDSAMLLTTGSAVGGPAGAIVLFTAMAHEDALFEAREAGLPEEQAQKYARNVALLEGVVTTLMSSIGLGGMENAFGKSLRGGLKQFGKTLGKDLISELTEEEIIAIGTAVFKVNSGVDPNALDPDALQSTIYETALQTVVTMGLLEGSRKIIGKPSLVEQTARDTVGLVEDLGITKKEMQAVINESADISKEGEVTFQEAFRENLETLAKTKVAEKNGEALVLTEEGKIIEPGETKVEKPTIEPQITEEAVTEPVVAPKAVVEPLGKTLEAEWFHGTHRNIELFEPREVQGIDSIGIWATGDKTKAKLLFGPKIFKVEQTPKNLLEAHTDNFDDFFFSNKNLFKETFPNEPMSTLDEFKDKGITKKTNPELATKRAKYLDAFRELLEKAGHDGIIWKNSRIDLAKGDDPHDVVVIFNKEPIIATKVEPVVAEIAPTEVLPQERPLPKTAGQAAVIADAAAEIGTFAEVTVKTVKDVAKSVKSLSGKLVQRATTRFSNMGESGKKVSGDLKEIAFRSQKNANVDIADTNVVLHGVNHKNRVLIAQAINKRVSLDTLPGWLRPKVKQIRSILDRSLTSAQELGVQRTVKGQKIGIAGSGKAYPQVLNTKGQRFIAEVRAEGANSKRVFEAAKDIVDSGQAETIEEAITKMSQFSDTQLRGINRYLESERVELKPEYIEWDIQKVLPNLVEGNWLTLEAIRQWGYDQKGKSFPKANELIENINAEQGSDSGKEVEDFIKFSFGAERAPADISKLSKTIRGAQFVSKVALSPLTIVRNMLDRGVKGLTIGDISTNVKATALYPPFLNKWIKESQRIENEMIRAGAISGHGAISADVEAGQRTAVAIGKPFSSSERGNQVFIALVRKLQLEKDLAKLVAKHNQNPRVKKFLDRVDAIMGNSEKQLRYRLEKETLDFDTISTESLVDEWVNNGGQVSGDQLERILHRAVRDKTFPVILSTKRSWWDKSPLMRVFAQFKTWPVEQTAHIYNDVMKYTLKTGDPTRLVRWMAGTAIAGELYNLIRDLLFDRDESITKKAVEGESPSELALALGNDFFDGGGVGMFADFSYGLTNWAVGVSGNSLKNFSRFTTDVYDNPSNAADAFGQLAEREASAIRQVRSILTKIDQIDNEGSLSAEYWPARSKAFDWQDDKRLPTTGKKVGKALKEFLMGRPEFERNAKTLSYELAARQIIVGDIDDAAKHLGRILEDIEINSVDDITKAIKGIKGSGDRKSPLGPVKDADMEEFLKTVPDVGEITQAQKDWTRTYNEAIITAASDKWSKKTPGMTDYLGNLAKKLSSKSIDKNPLERKFIVDFSKAMGASLKDMNKYLEENMNRTDGEPDTLRKEVARDRALSRRSDKLFTDWNRIE